MTSTGNSPKGVHHEELLPLHDGRRYLLRQNLSPAKTVRAPRASSTGSNDKRNNLEAVRPQNLQPQPKGPLCSNGLKANGLEQAGQLQQLQSHRNLSNLDLEILSVFHHPSKQGHRSRSRIPRIQEPMEKPSRTIDRASFSAVTPQILQPHS